MQIYPTSLQDFEGIIQGGCVYVDKTEYMIRLAHHGKYYFLSRPRRFGKSMFVSALEQLFQGKKELFKGLYAEDNWDWSTSYPVIHLSFANIGFVEKGLRNAILDRLIEMSVSFDVEIKDISDISTAFRNLILEVEKKYEKIVVLIDEYDKPIINYLGENDALAIQNRNTLRNFFSILKDADKYLKFVFITGVTKFTKVSIFSDLNNLVDITTDKRYAGICGITEQELQKYFSEELTQLGKDNIKDWYNGYTWDLKTWVYNPYSLINYFDSRQLRNYWYDSGTPKFLVNILKERKQFNFYNLETNLRQLSGFDIEKIDSLALMFQSGYLTLASYDAISNTYFLKYPNKEVEEAFNEFLLNTYIEADDTNTSVPIITNMRRALISGDLDKLKDYLNTLFKTIPSKLWEKHSEDYFHSILHLTFKLLAYQIQSEVSYADGTVDSLVEVTDKVYAIEVKLDKSADDALAQIKEKGYLDAYKNSGKKCIAIGINFSSKSKKIEEMKWEE